MPKEHQLAGAKVRALCKDREGLLWLIVNQGALYSCNVRFTLLETPFSTIQAICTDAQGKFWFGAREGLFLRKERGFLQVLPKKENIVSLWVSPVDGNIWAGSLGNGLFLVRPDGCVLRHLPERETKINGSILSIAGDSNYVWLATLDGVSVLNAKTLQREKFRKEALQQNLTRRGLYSLISNKIILLQ